MPRPSWVPLLPPLCPRPESGLHPLLSARSGLPAGSRGCPGDDERRINGAQGRQRCLPAALPAGSHCHRAAAARCAALRVGARSGVGLRTSVHPRLLGATAPRPGTGKAWPRASGRPLPRHKLQCIRVRSLEDVAFGLTSTEHRVLWDPLARNCVSGAPFCRAEWKSGKQLVEAPGSPSVLPTVA